MTHAYVEAELLELRRDLIPQGLSMHRREALWNAADIVARAGLLEAENRELRAKVERLQQALNEAVPMYSVKRQGGAE